MRYAFLFAFCIVLVFGFATVRTAQAGMMAGYELWSVDNAANLIARYHGETGEFLGYFTSDDPADNPRVPLPGGGSGLATAVADAHGQVYLNHDNESADYGGKNTISRFMYYGATAGAAPGDSTFITTTGVYLQQRFWLGPHDLCADNQHLYVGADGYESGYYRHAFRFNESDGSYAGTQATPDPTVDARFTPSLTASAGILALNPEGTLHYLSKTGAGGEYEVWRTDADGTPEASPLLTVPLANITSPSDMVIDANGRIYICGDRNGLIAGEILRYTSDGDPAGTNAGDPSDPVFADWNTFSANANKLGPPGSMTLGPDGILYVGCEFSSYWTNGSTWVNSIQWLHTSGPLDGQAAGAGEAPFVAPGDYGAGTSAVALHRGGLFFVKVPEPASLTLAAAVPAILLCTRRRRSN